jgi:hypothetical protein
LKYATLASYLDPKPTEVEITEALRSHYLPYIQRAMVNKQLKTIADTLEALRRLELIDNKNSSPKLNISREIRGHGNNRSFETRLTRRIQEYPTYGEHSDYRNKGKDYHKENRITFTQGPEVNVPVH